MLVICANWSMNKCGSRLVEPRVGSDGEKPRSHTKNVLGHRILESHNHRVSVHDQSARNLSAIVRRQAVFKAAGWIDMAQC